MTQAKKQDIIAKVTSLLSRLLDDDEEIPIASSVEHPVEMLTIKECTQEIRGLNEFTVRQLIARNEIPFVRAGQGKNGKILIPKAALIAYLNGIA
ncbi:MAG: helix-turn-helix domain-containing protein [Oscillospiraceae bacterium]